MSDGTARHRARTEVGRRRVHREEHPADLGRVRAGVERYRRRRASVRDRGSRAGGGGRGPPHLLRVGGRRAGRRTLPPADERRARDRARVRARRRRRFRSRPRRTSPGSPASNDGIVSRVEVGSESSVLGARTSERSRPTSSRPADGLWIADRDNNRIVQLDPETGDEIQYMGAGRAPRTHRGGHRGHPRDGRWDRRRPHRPDDRRRRDDLLTSPVIDIAMGEKAFWVLTAEGRSVADRSRQRATRAEPRDPQVVGEGEITYPPAGPLLRDRGEPDAVALRRRDGRGDRSDPLAGPVSGHRRRCRGPLGPGARRQAGRGSTLWIPRPERSLDEGARLDDDPVDIVTGDDGVWVALASGGRVVLVR